MDTEIEEGVGKSKFKSILKLTTPSVFLFSSKKITPGDLTQVIRR